MPWKWFIGVVVSIGIICTLGCAGLEKSKDFATGLVPHEVDEKLFNQLPDEKKDAINPLLDSVKGSKERLELARAVKDQKKAELKLENAKTDMAEIELGIREAELNLGKMKAVQSAGLGDPRKVNQQVAKLEAKVYKLKGKEAEQGATIKNAQLALEKLQEKVRFLEDQIHKNTKTKDSN